MAQRWNQLSGSGTPGAPGAPGSPGAGATPQAPDLISATAVPAFSLSSNVTAFTFNGQITVDDGNANWSHSTTIVAVAYGPSAPNGHEIARLLAPFTVVAHKVSYAGEVGAFLQAATVETWAVTFTVYDELGVRSATPVTVSGISVAPASVFSVTASEAAPRFQDQNQGILTKLTTTVTMTNGQVPQNVTHWLSRDNGTTKLLQGWTKITSSPQTLTLPYPKTLSERGYYDGYYIPEGANETWIVYAAAGPLTDANPPAGAVSCAPFTVSRIQPPSAVGVTSATSTSAITFTDAIGLPDWAIPLVSWTDPDITHSGNANFDINAWFTVLTIQTTDAAGNPAPGAGSGNDMGGDEVEVARAPVLGGAVQTCTSINSFGFKPSVIYTYACLRLYTVNRLSTTSWKDATNSVKQSTCWSGANKLLVNFGAFPGASLSPAAFAPNVSTPTANVNFVTVGGLPKWNVTGQLTLPNPFTAIKRIHVTAQGLPEVVAIPSAQFGISPFTLAGQVLSYATQNFDRDTVTLGYTLNFWVENSDGILTSAPPSANITVTGTAAPFSSTAPLAPQISTATASAVYWLRGHVYDFGFFVDLTAPSNPGGGAYSIRATMISPLGQVFPIDTLPGPFTVGQHYTFTSGVANEVQTSVEVWTVRLLPINADNVAAPSKDIFITITPVTVNSATVVETGPRVADANRALSTSITVTPTLNLNLGGVSGKQVVTIWTIYDWGDNGVQTTWKGWYDVIGTSTGLLLSGDNKVYVTLLPSTVVTVRVAIGAIDKGIAIPASAATGTFTFSGPTATATSLVSGLSMDALIYYTVGAGFAWKPGTISGNAPFSTHPELKSTRFTVEDGQWNGSTWTPDPSINGDQVSPFSTRERAFTDVDQSVTKYLTGDSLKLALGGYPWPYPAASATYRSFRIRVWAENTAGVWVLQNGWPASGGPTGVQYATSACYITPDVTKASFTIVWDDSMLGQGLVTVGGKPTVRVAGVSTAALTNPGFESGSLSGWSSSGSVGVIGSGQQRSGSFAAFIQIASGFVEQAIPLVGGQGATGVAYVTSVGGNDIITVMVRYWNGLNGTGSVLATYSQNQAIIGGFVYAQVNVLAASAPFGTQSASLRIQVGGSMTVGYWLVDDCSLTPSSSAGGGVGFDGLGALKINPSTTVGVDGSNNMAVLNASLGKAQFGGVYEPYAFYAGLPAIDSTTPKVIINVAVSPWKVYRQTGFGGWTAQTDPNDIVAGTITALVQMISPTISGGSISGATLSLLANNILTTLNNNFDGGATQYIGCKVLDQVTGAYAAHHSFGYYAGFSGGQAHMHCVSGYGRIFLQSNFGTSIAINGNGQVVINGNFAQTTTVPYVKPGGASGVMTFNSGWLTSLT